MTITQENTIDLLRANGWKQRGGFAEELRKVGSDWCVVVGPAMTNFFRDRGNQPCEDFTQFRTQDYEKIRQFHNSL